jgi:type IV secretory pathway TraG/TraD family ATPase VirD4
MATAPARSESVSDWPIFALVAAIVAAGVLWAAGALSAVLSGHPVPHGHPFGGLAAFAHAGDPSVAWGAPLGSSLLYWTVTAVVVAVLMTLVWLGWRLWHGAGAASNDPALVEGLADRRQVTAIAGTKALLARAATLRPSLTRPSPVEVGYFLGRSRGVGCWASVEDSIVVVGPPRSGKGFNLVIPAILDAPGAVITTSTRSDNLAATMTARSKLGPVAVFDPQGLAAGVSSSLRWSPIRGCEEPQIAMMRAWALCADAGQGTESESFWQQQTIAAVRCLLHAAAIGPRTPADLYRWSLTAAAAKEAVDILVDTPGAAPEWDRALDAIIASDPRQRDSVWAMVANAFAALADPHVLASVSPGPEQGFDPGSFLADRGTLYLLGTASGASATANLVVALVEDVVEVARRVAAASVGARLDPPLGLILDEAANYPLPSLGALMSEGGGTGITTMTVLQSLAQARDRWGRETAGVIWDSAIVKLVLPGSSNADDLADISRLLGDRTVVEHTETTQRGGGKSVSASKTQRPILDPATIRTIRPGHALLLLRSAKPIMLSLQPWTARPDAKAIRAARTEIEASFRAAITKGIGKP